jgi:hypothetical protein
MFVSDMTVRRMSAESLEAAAKRLEEISLEEANLHAKLREQVENFGSIPSHAEKSRRLETASYQFTISTSSSTEIKDAEVLKIQEACDDGLFEQLFQRVTKFKLGAGAMKILAGTLPPGAPSNLRKMFAQAVIVKEGKPRLRIEKVEVMEPA